MPIPQIKKIFIKKAPPEVSDRPFLVVAVFADFTIGLSSSRSYVSAKNYLKTLKNNAEELRYFYESWEGQDVNNFYSQNARRRYNFIKDYCKKLNLI